MSLEKRSRRLEALEALESLEQITVSAKVEPLLETFDKCERKQHRECNTSDLHYENSK